MKLNTGSICGALGLVLIMGAVVVSGQGGYINCQQPYGCSAEGYFVNPNNCHSFYRCWDFDGQNHLVTTVFNCGPYLWFDEVNGGCNWPWLVDPVPRCAQCPISAYEVVKHV